MYQQFREAKEYQVLELHSWYYTQSHGFEPSGSNGACLLIPAQEENAGGSEVLDYPKVWARRDSVSRVKINHPN